MKFKKLSYKGDPEDSYQSVYAGVKLSRYGLDLQPIITREDEFGWLTYMAPGKHTAKKKPRKSLTYKAFESVLAVWTRLELATPCVTGMYSNQLNYQTFSKTRYAFVAAAKIHLF
jgi:hypothetical protein